MLKAADSTVEGIVRAHEARRLEAPAGGLFSTGATALMKPHIAVRASISQAVASRRHQGVPLAPWRPASF